MFCSIWKNGVIRHAMVYALLVFSCAVVVFGCGCGGAPSTLKFKGLSLGMPIEDAGRVMMGLGYELGGKVYPEQTAWVEEEYMEALGKHAEQYIRDACKEKGFTSMRGYLLDIAEKPDMDPFLMGNGIGAIIEEEVFDAYTETVITAWMPSLVAAVREQGFERFTEYLKSVMPPEKYAANERDIRRGYPGLEDYITTEKGVRKALEKWLRWGKDFTGFSLPADKKLPEDVLAYIEQTNHDSILALENLPELLKRWGDPRETLLLGDESFQTIQAYKDEHYPDGPPYALGGPWDGKSPLKLKLKGDDQSLKGAGWTFYVDDERKLSAMVFEPFAVRDIFNAGDMSPEEFARSFISAYGIPEMKPYYDDSALALWKTGWRYVNRKHGWSVDINEAKWLTVEKVTASSEAKFD